MSLLGFFPYFYGGRDDDDIAQLKASIVMAEILGGYPVAVSDVDESNFYRN